MSKYSIIENPSAELWDSFLKNFPEGNFHQSFEYGEISKLSFPKIKAARLAIIYNEEPIGIVQGTYSNHYGFGLTLKITHGPVVKTEDEQFLSIVENLLIALEDYSKKNRIIQAQMLVPEAWQLDKIFHTFGYTATYKNEYVVSLENGPDQVWKNISHNKRRNIKRAMEKGVEVIQSHDAKDLLNFYSMLEAVKKRTGVSSHSLSWFKAIWEVYKPELSKLFLACWEGKYVSGVFTVIHGNTVYALASGSLSEGWKLMPNDIMHWKAMEWGSQEGYLRYHMGIVDEPLPTKESKAWGIWRWKREWKGSLEKIQVFDRTILPKYSFVLKTQNAKKFLRKVYTRIKQVR